MQVIHTIREPMPSSTQIKSIMYSLSTAPSEPEYVKNGDVISFRQNELAHNFMVHNQPIVVQVGVHRSLDQEGFDRHMSISGLVILPVLQQTGIIKS